MDKLKIGVFGVYRGLAYIKAFNSLEDCEITAICDKAADKVEKAKEYLSKDVKIADTFDELLDSGIDAVVLCNYFSEHAPYAIKALKKNIHVMSECTAAVTPKQCVELVEAAEESRAVYALAENYPWNRSTMEIRRVYQSGMLGRVVFAEGEYVHPMPPARHDALVPDETHWRACNPINFYSTHAIAPLIAATDLMPKRVIGKVAAEHTEDGRAKDGAGIMLVEMEDGSLFRVSGSNHFGGHGNWYRLGCQKGGIENLRGSDDKVRIAMNEWQLTDENRMYGTECVYSPEVTELIGKAAASGHGGGDYMVSWDFREAVKNNRKPLTDVYRAAALSLIALYGWRSILEDSRQLDIPDMKKKEDREFARKDDRNPFIVEGRAPTMPHTYIG